jgi:hypothetical protein
MKYPRVTLMICAALLVYLQSISQVSAPPQISVNSDVLIADVRKGGIRTFEFILTNSGDKDLLIHDIKKSCGCTEAIVEQTKIKPGEKSALRIIYTHTGTSSIYSSSVVVKSNANNNPAKLLKISGNVYFDSIHFAPEKLMLSAISKMDNINGCVEVKSDSGQHIQVVNCNARNVIFEGSKTGANPFNCYIQNEGAKKIIVDVSPKSLKAGKYSGILCIDAKVSGTAKKYELPLSLTILPDVSFYPEMISLIIGNEGSESQHRVAVKSNAGKSMKIKSVICPVYWIDISHKKVTSSTSFLYFKIKAPAAHFITSQITVFPAENEVLGGYEMASNNKFLPPRIPIGISVDLNGESLNMKYIIALKKPIFNTATTLNKKDSGF